ncbi:hypothetical protein OEK23_003246 [Vibrio cholerae]|uniref:hypothetical protein n=1 Tax=Vibrio cholerae TaxID=666 RepID=UPI000BA9A62C|nr:hypothetical protein [Vibrio cholerae]EGR1402300.1 hypothetical protein [Vibrio cholerae]EGR1428811.1 hypothetical protein [Vibrio cholerae]EHE6926354.1 hypothetical protein [Vibrio cholerae]EJX7572133.1 hypothetical protein [Vibrio cholerae]PAR78284.1 hypothetical protein CGT87_12070 [Vibrio cholerae]
MAMSNVLYYVIPYQLIITGAFCYFLSKLINPVLSIVLFFLIYLLSIFGLNFISVAFISFGIYSLGYTIRKLINSNDDYSAINITYGIIALFFPLFILSILSTTKLAEKYHYFSSTKLTIIMVFIMLSLTGVYFLYSEKLKLLDTIKSITNKTELSIFSFAIITIILSIVTYSNIPIINYDDLGTHFLVQSQFSLGSYPSFDVSNHVWALSQWIFDIYYGLFEFLYNYQGRTVLNIILAISIIAIGYETLSNYFGMTFNLLTLLLCVSTPLFSLALTTSQTELVTVLLLISVISLVFNYDSKSFLTSLPIFAFAVALKPSNAVVFIFPFIAFVLFEIKHYRFININKTRCILVLLLSAFMAFSLYLFSYLRSGNPFFPLFNSIFKSDHFPHADFYNSLYSGNFNINAFYGVIFETSKYLESYDGVAGYHLLLLPVFLVLSFFVYKVDWKVRVFFITTVIGGIVVFYSQQYARYIMPVIVVLPMFYVLILRDQICKSLIKKSLLSIVMIGFIMSNLQKIPFVIWYMNNWKNSSSIFSMSTRDKVKQIDHILSINNYLNSIPDKKVVVYPYEKPYASNLNSEYIYVNWYNSKGFDSYLKGENHLVEFLEDKNASHIILIENNNDVLRRIAEKHGSLLYKNHGYEVYSISFKN